MSTVRRSMVRSAFIALSVVLSATNEAADIAYYANPDPTTVDGYPSQPGSQPWVFNPTGTQPGSGVMDGATPAWELNGSGAPESYYTVTPTAAHVVEGFTIGWTLTTRLRLPTISDSVGGGVQVDYGDGSKIWAMNFGTDGDGDPVVRLVDFGSNPTFTLQGAGTNSYHTYSLKYDPVALTADLFVDGVEQISNHAGLPIGGITRVDFGDNTSDAGHGLYNLVEWTAPEPSTAMLLVLAGLLMCPRRHG